MNKLGCDASAKLHLTVREHVCYLTKRVAKNLDAYGRAKAAPKTKSYALDADAKEDPGLVREEHGTGDTGESFEPAFEDALDPDIDGEVRLKAGDAPLKVHHPLTSSQRLQAMTFHRQKHTKFVRDMISAGLLPLTGDEEALHRTAAYKRASGTAVSLREEQLRLKEKAPMITQQLLDAQRAAMTSDIAWASTVCGRNRLLRATAQSAEESWLQTVMTRLQQQNGAPSASHLQQWLGRLLRLKSRLVDSSWRRSNCLLADGLVRQWMQLYKKKRTKHLCETVRSTHAF